MLSRVLRFGLAFCMVGIAFSFILANPASAQKKKDAAPVGLPQIQLPYPMGIQRGGTIELPLQGSNLDQPTSLWTSFPCEWSFGMGNTATSLSVRITVAADAPLGIHGLRVATSKGISNLRLFCVDELPTVQDLGAHQKKEAALEIAAACVVAGKVQPEASNYYRLKAPKGRLSCEILGRRLGSAVDPQITLLDAKTGRELPGAHSNDAPGLQTDCRLSYIFKEPTEVLIEVRDALWRGGADYAYRLRVGDFPFATAPIPMAIRRGSQQAFVFAGPQAEDARRVEAHGPIGPESLSLELVPRSDKGQHGTPVVAALSRWPELLEHEPNNELKSANKLPLPCGVTARLQQPGDVDCFAIRASKGQKLLIECHSVEWHSPTEVYFVLKDDKGSQLAACDPSGPPRLEYTPDADRDIFIVAEHLLYWSGPGEAYRLTVSPAGPSYEVNLTQDRVQVAPGSAVAVPIQVVRKDYTGPIELSIEGNPYFQGRALVPAGKSEPAPQAFAGLFLEAREQTPPGGYSVTVIGRAMVDGKLVSATASSRQPISQALANLTYPPKNLIASLSVGALPKPAFVARAKAESSQIVKGVPLPVAFEIARSADCKGPIEITPLSLPQGATATFKTIPAESSIALGSVTLPATVPDGEPVLVWQGATKVGETEHKLAFQPIHVKTSAPFLISLSGAEIKVGPGQKAKLSAVIYRQGGYQGPISFEWKGLPTGISAAKVILPTGQRQAELELAAAAMATSGTATLVGTATEAGNLQVVSEPVRIVGAGK